MFAAPFPPVRDARHDVSSRALADVPLFPDEGLPPLASETVLRFSSKGFRAGGFAVPFRSPLIEPKDRCTSRSANFRVAMKGI